MTYAEAREIMTRNNWFTERRASKDWKWTVARLDRDALGGVNQIDCQSNGFATQAEAVADAVAKGFAANTVTA